MTIKGNLLYEGKSKKVFQTNDPNILIQEFKDDVTAFNDKLRDNLKGKGSLNGKISTILFKYLLKQGIESHYIESISAFEMKIWSLKIIPVEVIVRNRVAGSQASRLGVTEGTQLPFPVISFHIKSDKLGDPLVLEDELLALKICDKNELETMKTQALQINQCLQKLFLKAGIILVDFKLEFGKDHHGNIKLADEISPDSCRLWDRDSLEKMDKDRFRRGLGDLVKFYNEVLQRLEEHEHV